MSNHKQKTHLNLDTIQEARRAADQRTTGKGELGDGVVATFVQHTRTVGNAAATLELLGNQRVVLELLKMRAGRGKQERKIRSDELSSKE